VAVDASGNVVVTGDTSSGGWVSGGFDTSYIGNANAFVAKLSPSGAHIWSTYLAASSNEWGEGVAVDASGNAVVTGYTDSSGWVSGGFDTSYNGGSYDAFVAKVTEGRTLTIKSSPVPGVQISGDMPGTTDYTAKYDLEQTVSLAAPSTVAIAGKHYNFMKWTLDGIDQPDNPISITMGADHAAVAEYDVCAWTLSVQSFPIGGAAITGDASGTTPFTSGCTDGDSVQLSAPATIAVDGKAWYFAYWLIGTAAQTRYRRDVYIIVSDDTTATAVYDPTIRGDVNGDCKVNVLDLIDARNRLGSMCSQ